jgi:hypothetical protein
VKRKPKKAILERFPGVSRILSVDPGAKAGFALIVDGAVEESAPINGADVFAIWDCVKRCKPDLVLIEDQFTGPNPKTVKAVILRRGHWETIAKLRMLPVTTINPSTWLAWVKTKRGDKSAYHRLATAILGRKVETEDEAAAILMGLCYRAKTV